MTLIDNTLRCIGLLVMATAPFYLAGQAYWCWKNRQAERFVRERFEMLRDETQGSAHLIIHNVSKAQ